MVESWPARREIDVWVDRLYKNILTAFIDNENSDDEGCDDEYGDEYEYWVRNIHGLRQTIS